MTGVRGGQSDPGTARGRSRGRSRSCRRLLLALLLPLTLAACGDGAMPADRLAALGRDLAAAAEAARPALPETAACPCPETPPEAAAPALLLTPARFDDLPGWGEDAVEEALPALIA